MKVLVATKKTQGKRRNDFCKAKEGELLKLGPECDGGSIDDDCGCRRSLVGFSTLKPCTTFKVVEADLSLQEYSERFIESETRESPVMTTNTKALYDAAGLLLEIASRFPIGTVVERRGDVIQSRTLKDVISVRPSYFMPYRKVHERQNQNVAILRIPIRREDYMRLKQQRR